MKRGFCAAILVLTAAAALASTAFAGQKGPDPVRAAQARLSGLGYYHGPLDGVLGVETRQALVDFQGRNGLAATGTITADTRALLMQGDAAGGYYTVVQPTSYGSYVYNNVAAAGPATWNPRGRLALAHPVPSRFAAVSVNEDRRSTYADYTVTVNGQPVLVSSHQGTPLRVSQTYNLNGEDAVIFTATDGAGGCAYRSYLLTVHADGSATTPQQIGNCSGGYQAGISGGQLVVSFPSGQYATAATMWDRWSYSNGYLARL